MDYDNAWLQECFDVRLPEAGFDVREEQLAMANYVQTALTRNRHLLAEAGVGTGKTFAYLLPAFAQLMRTRRPILIATHTIALQEQLINKDIPAVRKLLGEPLQAYLAKGREHYLCPARELALRERTPEPTPEEARLQTWARRTRKGDRSELPDVPESLWQQVNMNERSRCVGCRYEFTCPTNATRRRWQDAWGFIVTNHHQFFADMALRASGRHLFALPGAVILDEAHAIPDTAREMLGHRATLSGLRGAVEQARYQLHPEDRAWQSVLQRLETFEALLGPRVKWGASEEADRFEVVLDEALSKTLGALDLGLRNVADRLGGMRDTPQRHTAILRLEDAIGALRGLTAPASHIAWVEGSRGQKRVNAVANAPRNLAGILQTRLFGRGVPVVLTSATLSVAEDFTYMKEELGLDSPLACSVGSPFDYETQARLYIAEDLSDPGGDVEAFYRGALERVKEIVTTVGGRTLVLFTAKTRSKQAYQALKAWGKLPVMLQDRANPHMVEQFQAQPTAVLLGTAYWEGLDVPGLSAVVIVKLPFPAEDPLLKAKQDAAIARGEDPFDAVLLPEMLLKLKQGSGRLIRRSTDRGIIAILDPRAATRERYRDLVVENLPPAPRIPSGDAVNGSLEEMRAFLHGDAAVKH